MSVSIDNHPHAPGITPQVSIINWGGRITLKIKVGDFRVTSYLDPLTDEPTSDYIERIIAALGEVEVDSESEAAYA